MRLSIIANPKIVRQLVDQHVQKPDGDFYLEDPFTTSQSTLLEVAHGGTMVVPSVAHTHYDPPINHPASTQLGVSGPSVMRGLCCIWQYSA